VLEHVPDPVAALKELARITKCDGQLIITAPFCSLTHFAPFHFCTGFSSYWYKKHLSDLNFEINKFDHNGGWFDYLAQEIFRLPYIGKTYSSRTLGFTGFIFSLPLLFILSLLKKIDRGSHEMLTYGFHVVAIKSR